jgi:hypothetical protein
MQLCWHCLKGLERKQHILKNWHNKQIMTTCGASAHVGRSEQATLWINNVQKNGEGYL